MSESKNFFKGIFLAPSGATLHIFLICVYYIGSGTIITERITQLSMEEHMKDAIRKRVLEVRNKLSDDEVYRLCENIFRNLRENSFFNSSDHVMVYLDFKHEVKTDFIIDYCLEHGKKVHIPICIPEPMSFAFRELQAFLSSNRVTLGYESQ